jgi:hypothetical protein
MHCTASVFHSATTSPNQGAAPLRTTHAARTAALLALGILASLKEEESVARDARKVP